MNMHLNVRSRILLCAFIAVLALMATPLGAHASGNQFFTITPCRAVDTRTSSGTIPANGSRSFLVVGALSGQGGQSTCGIPSGATGVFLNAVAIAPTAQGHLTIYPWPGPQPPTSTLNFTTGQTVANGALIPICNPIATNCTADITVTMGPASAHLVIDVTGYIAPATTSSITTRPVTVGWLKIEVPYTWHQSDGRIGAMFDDGKPQPAYTSTLSLRTLACGQMLALPRFQTTAFTAGTGPSRVRPRTSARGLSI